MDSNKSTIDGVVTIHVVQYDTMLAVAANQEDVIIEYADWVVAPRSR